MIIPLIPDRSTPGLFGKKYELHLLLRSCGVTWLKSGKEAFDCIRQIMLMIRRAAYCVSGTSKKKSTSKSYGKGHIAVGMIKTAAQWAKSILDAQPPEDGIGIANGKNLRPIQHICAIDPECLRPEVCHHLKTF